MEIYGKNNRNEITTIFGVDNLDKWKEITKEEWHEEIFTNTEVTVGNPITAENINTKVTLVEPDDPLMKTSIQSLYKENYPELVRAKGAFEVLEQINKLRSEGTEKSVQKKIIKITHNGIEEELWESFRKLREETVNETLVAIHHVKNIKMIRLRKMVECIFHETDTTVIIYTNKQNPELKTENRSRNERKTFALVVEESGKDYNATLKMVKEAVSGKPECKEIKNIRSTKDGKLLITTSRDTVAMEALQGAISRKSTDVKTWKLGQEKPSTVIIRSMDAETTMEEVTAAVVERIGLPAANSIKIGNLRPNANNTQAVTIGLSKEEADKLINKKRIRIGIVECAVEERIDLERCRKCGAYDHHIKDCKGPDRRNLCYNCGKEGHTGKQCNEKTICQLCEKNDHRMGTSACPLFRKALAEAKKSKRNRERKREEEDIKDTRT